MHMHVRRLIISSLVFGSLAGTVAMADDPAPAAAPAAPTAPSLTDILTASGITVTGLVSASYYASSGYSTDHQFDTKHNTFQLDQTELTVAYQPKEGFGALVNVGAGEDMKILHFAEDGHTDSFDVIQGFVQYATGPLTVIAGKYVTLAGQETINPVTNANFSRSLLFYADPLTHTGVRATYAVNDTLNVIAGVNNGWNYTSLSTSGAKTGELGLAWTPNKIFSLTAQAYIGKDPTFDAERDMIDVVANYTATDALSFGLNADWGEQKQHTGGEASLNWNVAAFYTNYAWTDQWRTTLRVEYLDDKGGFVTGAHQTLKEATVTVGYAPIKSFEVRIEGRYDSSNEQTFLKKLLPLSSTENPYAKDQTGFAIEGVYHF